MIVEKKREKSSRENSSRIMEEIISEKRKREPIFRRRT
jgi:hypothetical protein